MKPNTQANAKFAQMTDEFVKDSLALSPVNASAGRLSQAHRSQDR